tara:strand:- start:5250 stop:7211 length:1962 start_codon:yes stop_codon:yes gene_type:complete
MCGLAGIITSHDEELESSMNRMLELISHRGPDGRGIKILTLKDKGYLALGHNRLAIIDTSDAGLMPMQSKDGTYHIIFNGEIFNYIELKQELLEIGYKFDTQTDTEVLLNAYIEWGSNCLNKLNGMFSFAIHDSNSDELFVARDRYGVKPLYYYYSNNIFTFASEIKSLLTIKEVPARPNNDVLGKFLLTGVINDSEKTCFDDIFSLKPGHYLKFNQKKLEIKKWYKFYPLDPSKYEGNDNFNDSIEDFKVLFNDAVRLRLRSDVEVGACLSGGLDSSAIVGSIAQILSQIEKTTKGSFKTFSSIYQDPEISEVQYVQAVTELTKTKNFSFSPNPDKFWSQVSNIVWHNDEPIQTPTIFNQWTVMEVAKHKGVKVTLDGQGVDELAGGYPTYFSIYLAELLRKFKFIQFFKTFREIVSKEGEGRNLFSLLFRICFHLLPKQILTLLLFIPPFKLILTNQSITPLLKNEFVKDWFKISKKQLFLQKMHSSSLQERLSFDLSFISIPALLRYEDRSSMASSIEARTPFLDFRLVEKIQTLPSKFLIKNGLSKALIREGVKDLIPSVVFNRTDKKGYPIPSSNWLNMYSSKIKKLFLQDAFLNKYFNKDLGRLFDLHDNSLKGEELWRILFAELWFREFFEKDINTGAFVKHSKFS